MNYYIKPFSLSQTTTKNINVEIQALHNGGLTVGVYHATGTESPRFYTVEKVSQVTVKDNMGRVPMGEKEWHFHPRYLTHVGVMRESVWGLTISDIVAFKEAPIVVEPDCNNCEEMRARLAAYRSE
jgi:Na+-transporting NADH:ubiquinone oxidoreductase subunit NqrA